MTTPLHLTDDELLKFGSPRTMIDALEVTVRRMKMQQEAA